MHDPQTTAEQLAAVLYAFPEFGVVAIDHPHAYPQLQDWIRENVISG